MYINVNRLRAAFNVSLDLFPQEKPVSEKD